MLSNMPVTSNYLSIFSTMALTSLFMSLFIVHSEFWYFWRPFWVENLGSAEILVKQRRRNGFKSEGAHLNFLKSAPTFSLCPPLCDGQSWAQRELQTGTASCEFSYFTAFILSP